MPEKKTRFPVLHLTREDFTWKLKVPEAIVANIPDADMECFAYKLGQCLMDGGDYWMFIREEGPGLLRDLKLWSKECFECGRECPTEWIDKSWESPGFYCKRCRRELKI